MEKQNDMKITHKNKNLWIIIGIILIYGIGMTIVFPLLPFLLGKYLPASQIVIGLSALTSVYAVCQFLAAPAFGALSDRFGRKSILLISLLGSVAGYIMFGIGGALWILFLGRIIDGLTAGDISTLLAYIADSTEPHERTKWYGYVGAAIGLGSMIGPAIGGLLGTVSITLPFFVTAGIIFISFLCAYFFLPESLTLEKRTKRFSVKHINPFAHFKDIFALKEARSLLVMGAFFYIGLSVYQFNMSIFMKDVFLWGPALIGGLIALIGACDIVSRAFLLPQLLKKFNERVIGIAGLCGLILGFVLIFISAYITSTLLIIAAVISITIGEGLFDPSYNARLSSSVDESKQGQLQGTNQSLQSAYRVMVPLAAAAIYTYSHSAIFGIAALLMAWALVMFIKLQIDHISDSPSIALHQAQADTYSG